MIFFKYDIQCASPESTHLATMSKTFNTTKTTNTKTPYCKVCHDAGRPESEYTSHYVKDQPGPDGKVVCPTLLNQACRICQQTGHTSTYCPRYRPRQPAAEEHRPRYIEREPLRRESDRRDVSFNRLREDTERHERDIRVRDDAYNREQDRRSKPWLQAALSTTTTTTTTNPRERRGPYAHPHGPRVRLELESRALSSSAVVVAPVPVIDVRKLELHHATNWCDEEPEKMADEMFKELARENRRSSSSRHDDYISREDDDLITMSLGGGHIQFAGYD
jgi:hypothetical protein